MGTVRIRRGSLVALIAAALLVVTGLVSPADAATARSLSIAASPTTGYAGSTVTMSGKLTKSPKGTVVRIQRKSGKKWVAAKNTATTSTAGAWTAKVPLPSTGGTYSFRAVSLKTKKLKTATSRTIKVVALKKLVATMKASASVIQLNNPVTLSGTIAPFTAGKVAFIQRYNGVTWTILATATISKKGGYARTFSPPSTAVYRVYVPKSGYTAAGASPSTKVTVSNGPITPVITTTSLPNGRTETAYNQTLTKTNSGAAGTWTVTAGALPGGLSLNATTGAITGTPTATGDSTFTVTFSETSTGQNASKSLSIHVDPVLKITTTSLPNATAFSTYTPVQFTKSGLDGTWSVTGTLPTGMSFSAAGSLSGKPTVSGDFPLTFKFTETAGGASTTKALSLHVNVAPDPVITTTALPDATAFQVYTASVAKTGNAGTWAITNGTLPTGITFDTSTGALSGKPTVSGDFPLTFKFTETESGTNASKALTLHVNVAPDPVITTTSLPTGTEFRTYAATLGKTGNAGTWSILEPLPPGITFDTSTGVFGGKPTTAGNYNLTVTFTETESGTHATKGLAILVNAAPDPVITTTSLPNATAFAPGYSTTLTLSAGVLPGTWAITGALPNGITFDTSTGTLSGKPTVSGDFPLHFTYTEDDSAKVAAKDLTLHVNPAPNPVISTSSLPVGIKGQAYTGQLATSTTNPGTWAITAGGLPTGIELNTATGALSGTPTVGGDFSVTFKFTETESGTFATKQLTLSVLDNPVVTTSSLPDATRGSSYGNHQLTKTGGSGTGTWKVTAGTLPAGLTLSTAGVISGTPTTLTDAANENFTVTFTDSITHLTGSKVLAIHVAMAGAPTFNTAPTLPDGKVGVSYSKTLSASGGLLNRWSVIAGSLPPGLNINAATGEISGTPTTAGDYAFVIRYGTTVPLTYNTRQYFIHVAP